MKSALRRSDPVDEFLDHPVDKAVDKSVDKAVDNDVDNPADRTVDKAVDHLGDPRRWLARVGKAGFIGLAGIRGEFRILVPN